MTKSIPKGIDSVDRREALLYLANLFAFSVGGRFAGRNSKPTLGDVSSGLFFAAEQGRFKKTPAGRPEFVEGPDMGVMTGFLELLGFQPHLAFANGGLFTRHADDLLVEISKRLKLDGKALWREQGEYLSTAIKQFFGGYYASLPGLILLLPIYISLRQATSKANWQGPAGNYPGRLPRFSDQVKAHDRNKGRDLPLDVKLQFGWAYENEPGIKLQRNDIHFFHPELKDRPYRPDLLFYDWRLRKKESGGFIQREENLGLVLPEDEKLLSRGYYPAYSHLLPSSMSVPYIPFRAVVLFRMRPNGNPFDAHTHQLFISMDPETAATYQFNCLSRPFALSIRHYPGLPEMLYLATKQ